MDAAGVAVFAGALLVAAATPGPGVAALVARVLARGPRGSAAFSAGLAIGDVAWLGAASGGLAAVAGHFATLMVAIRYCGAGYLLYLAVRLWTAPLTAERGEPLTPPDARSDGRMFLAGLAVTLGNPKVIVFYMALVPTLVDVAHLDLLAFCALACTCLVVLAVVFGAYILLAARARRLVASPRALRRVNRISGGVMAGAAIAVATR